LKQQIENDVDAFNKENPNNALSIQGMVPNVVAVARGSNGRSVKIELTAKPTIEFTTPNDSSRELQISKEKDQVRIAIGMQRASRAEMDDVAYFFLRPHIDSAR
jgi:hypothetical protein